MNKLIVILCSIILICICLLFVSEPIKANQNNIEQTSGYSEITNTKWETIYVYGNKYVVFSNNNDIEVVPIN